MIRSTDKNAVGLFTALCYNEDGISIRKDFCWSGWEHFLMHQLSWLSYQLSMGELWLSIFVFQTRCLRYAEVVFKALLYFDSLVILFGNHFYRNQILCLLFKKDIISKLVEYGWLTSALGELYSLSFAKRFVRDVWWALDNTVFPDFSNTYGSRRIINLV